MEDKNLFRLPDLSIPIEALPSLLWELDLMELLVTRHLERLHASKFRPSEAEQQEFLKSFLKKEGLTDSRSLNEWLNRNGLTEDAVTKSLYRSLQLWQLKNSLFSDKVESAFLKEKSSLDRVAYSILRVKERGAANEIYMQLTEEEETFSELASKFSEGPERERGGRLGPMEVGLMNPELAERLKASYPGQLWPPFEASGWWVILRHEKSYPSSLDEATREKIVNRLYQQWITSQITEWKRSFQAEAGTAGTLSGHNASAEVGSENSIG